MKDIDSEVQRYFFHLHYYPEPGDTNDPRVHVILEDPDSMWRYWFITAYDQRRNIAFGCTVGHNYRSFSNIDIKALQKQYPKIRIRRTIYPAKHVSDLLLL